MRIVCLGDSLTYGYKINRSEVWTKLVADKYGVEVLNKGIIGDSTTGMNTRFYRDVVENQPSHTIIMGGGNDLFMEVPISVVQSNIACLVHQARANQIIPIIGIPILAEPDMANEHWPNFTDFKRANEEMIEYRDRIGRFARIFNVQVINFAEAFSRYVTEKNKSEYYLDGLHPTIKGNQIMGNAVKLI